MPHCERPKLACLDLLTFTVCIPNNMLHVACCMLHVTCISDQLLSTAFSTHLTVYAKAAKPIMTQMFTRVLLMSPLFPSLVAAPTPPWALSLFCVAFLFSCSSPLSFIFTRISCKGINICILRYDKMKQRIKKWNHPTIICLLITNFNVQLSHCFCESGLSFSLQGLIGFLWQDPLPKEHPFEHLIFKVLYSPLPYQGKVHKIFYLLSWMVRFLKQAVFSEISIIKR